MIFRLLCLLAIGAILNAETGDLRGIWKADGKAYLDLETAAVIFDPPSGKIRSCKTLGRSTLSMNAPILTGSCI
jgi:hypothetical protein